MIHGLSEYEKYKVLRPIIGDCEYDRYDIPIIRRTSVDAIDWNRLKIIGVQNASIKTSDKNTLVTMFNYDKKLLQYWNNPLKPIGLFQGFAAVAAPDFSIYPSMNPNDIRHNIYMSRWLGVTWQNYGCIVLPTIQWGLPNTYDMSFGNVERESVVILSTIGCREQAEVFLDGFYEMKRRIKPPLIIVVGDMIEGMTGTFLNFKYTDSFCYEQGYKQLELEGISKIFTIKEVA